MEKGHNSVKDELKRYGNHIVQYDPDYSICAGCVSCSIMCGLTHEGFTGPGNSRIKVEINRRQMLHHVLSCYHCKDHPCYHACPKKQKAMKIDEKLGIVYVDEEFCIGCGLCAKHCPFTPSRISMIKDKDRKKWKAAKCDLCRNRPEGPACIQYCPVRCIGLSDDSEFVEQGLCPKGSD